MPSPHEMGRHAYLESGTGLLNFISCKTSAEAPANFVMNPHAFESMLLN